MIAIRSFVLGTLSAASVAATTLAGAAAVAWPAAAMAQERQPEARRQIYLDHDTTVVRNRIQLLAPRRARLGVTVDLKANSNDSVGATIESVTPGGPAAKAGLKSGDLITRLDGKVLTAAEGMRHAMDESLPGLRLVEIAAQLKPDQTVNVEYRRDGARRTVSLVTGNEPIMVFESTEGGRSMVFPKIDMERVMPRGGRIDLGAGRNGFAFAFGGPLMDLELAPLNPDLGQYFGTTEGVLVIDIPKESALGLKSGDVIQSVDGRKVSGPSTLLRILRSYDPGDSFKLEIMRNKAHLTVTGKLDKEHDE